MKFHERAYKPMDYKSLANLGTDLTTFQANQLQGLNQQISVGAGSPEVITLKRDVWETIPKQHFEEMRRLSKLTGVTPSVHAPMIDTSGLGMGMYSEEARKSEERIIEDVIEKAHLMAPDRNIIVNIHSDILRKGTIWRKNLIEHLPKEKRREILDNLSKSLFAKPYSKLTSEEKGLIEKELQKEVTFGVDKETGQVVPIKFDLKYVPSTEPGEKYKIEVWTPLRRLQSMNATQWMNEVETLHQQEFRLREILDRLKKGENVEGLEGYMQTIFTHTNSEIEELFHKLKSHSIYEDRNWNRLSEEEKKILAKRKEKYDEFVKKQLEAYQEIKRKMKEFAKREAEALSAGRENEAKLMAHKLITLERENLNKWTKFFAETVRNFTPARIEPLERFELEKASQTFAEAAEHSFSVAKGDLNRAPIISIENPPAQQFELSRAEQLKELVENARKKTAELLMKKHKLSEQQAKQAAEKLIGVTWDVGHINMLRQGGFTEKDILEETKKIAKHVKHLHITDNFGTADSHLVPGAGNVPIKKIQDILAKEGFKGKSIIESGGFISHFKTSPWPYVLDEMNSPIYEFDASPTWGPSFYSYFFGSASYPVGYGNILPSQHFSMYGAGFLLPPTFGAQTPGESKKSEFSGTPMS